MSRFGIRATVVTVSMALIGLVTPTRALADSPDATDVFSSPFSSAVVSACTGETITLQGTQKSLIHVHFDSAGGGHFRFFSGSKGAGTSETGTNYRFSETASFEQNFPSGQALEFSFVNNTHLITAGPNNNQMLHATIHVTYANGALTSEVFNFRIDCQ